MLYGYCRVSTIGQAKDGNGLEVQKKELIDKGIPEENIYCDAFTGTKMERPQLTKLLNKLNDGDTLVVAKLDRIARTATDGYELVQGLFNRGIGVWILNMGMVDNSPVNKLTLQIMFAYAEFERNMIVQRTQAGKAMARKNNPSYREGRKKKFTPMQINHAMELLKEHSYTEVAQLTGISKSTLIRAKRNLKFKK